MKERVDKLDFIKFKYFYSVKDNIKRMSRQASEGEKWFAKGTSDKGLLFKLYKEPSKLNNKKRNNLIKKWAKDFNGYHNTKYIEIANKHMKWCSTSQVIRKMQIKTTMRYHYICIWMAQIQNIHNAKCCRGREATGTLFIAGRNAEWHSHFER